MSRDESIESLDLSYASSMWVEIIFHQQGSIQTVIAQSVENRRIIDDIASILTDRARVEEKYAQGLEKIVNSFQKLTSKTKQFNTSINLFASQFSTKSQLSKQYALQIHEDIVPFLKNLVISQNLLIKPVVEECKKWEREISDLNSDIIKAETAYKYKGREYEQQGVLNVIYDLCSEFTNDKKLKQSQKAIITQQEYNECEKQYKQTVFDNNKYFERQYKQLSEGLNKFQLQELERQFNVKDALVRSIIYETSLQKNITYDFEKIAERVKDLDPEANIIEYLKQVKTDEPLYKEFKKSTSFIGSSIHQITSKTELYFLSPTRELQIETFFDQDLIMKESEYQLGEQGQFLLSQTKEVYDISQKIWDLTEFLQEDDLIQVLLGFYKGRLKIRSEVAH